MTAKINDINRPLISLLTVFKFGFSALVLFLIYIIWNGIEGLGQQLNVASDNSLAVHNLQVEYKTEVQEWKNLLLRSSDKESLEKNWQSFETKYQEVSASAQKIIQQNDVRRITDPIKTFVAAHTANYDQYKIAKKVLLKSGYIAHQADLVVMGIDRPLLNDLEKAAIAMQEEQNNANSRIAAKTSNQTEQILAVLALIVLLGVWIPKW